MLLITFSRAATQELRERVRRQIAHALACFGDPALAGDNQVVARLLECDAEEHQRRRTNLADALADFDAATIATVHQFCNIVLTSLGSGRRLRCRGGTRRESRRSDHRGRR